MNGEGNSVPAIPHDFEVELALRTTWHVFVGVKTAKTLFQPAPALQLVTESEAAHLLATPPGTLRYWRHQGRGPNFIRLGGRVKYDLAEVIDYVDRHRHVFSARATKGE